MSDVSKTNEALIAEAQQHYSEMNGLNSRAAEVMMELVAALEAKTGVRVDMSSAVGVETQLAATRVPVQGKPNDDREVLAYALFRHADMTREWRNFGEHVRKHWLEYADAVIELGFSRATVPDAATEELQADRDSLEERNTQLGNQLAAVLDERDAALAAVERVRAVVKSIRFLAALPPFDEGNTVMNAAADDIVVAIDGAPEPEVKR